MKSKIVLVALVLILIACMGPRGKDGASITGPKGDSGASCTQTKVEASAIAGDPVQYGGILITCSSGTQLITNGAPGSVGPQGVPGKAVTAIQLCPNGPPSVYGSVEEVAFCINDQLYALYQNPGTSDLILGELLPGSYDDHNGNLGCSFQVLLNCGVL